MMVADEGPGTSVVPAKMSADGGASADADMGALRDALAEVRRVIVGQDHMVERLLVALLARGHCLLEGVPGVAKTLAASTLATVVGGTFARIQFTPDLVPSDIVGTRVYHPGAERFDVELGPVFVNFLLADEINRAPAKVQSALLEVMAERQVSLAGVTHPLPRPFIVLATQNPIESEGVYPLPEVQRDRFLFKVRVDAPQRPRGAGDPAPDERHPADARPDPRRAAPARAAEVGRGRVGPPARRRLRRAPGDVHPHPADYGLRDLEETIEIGVSPRATLGLVAAGRALALLRGRDYLLPDDIRDVAVDVMSTGSCSPSTRWPTASSPNRSSARSCTPYRRPSWSGTRASDEERRAARCGKLELTVVRKLDGLLQGGHLGLLPGPGSEFGDTRVYVPGEDDMRRMDWNVTARTTVPHVRDLISDRELETWALVDLTASMDFGTADMDKRTLVIHAVGALGFLSSRVGDRFGAYVLHGEEVHRYPARPGRANLFGLLQSLTDAPRGQGTSSLGGAVEMLGRRPPPPRHARR